MAQTVAPKVSILVNMRSSRSHRDVDHLPELFAAHSIEIEHLWKPAGYDEVQRAFRKARKAKVRTLIVGGGDGTMTECANAFAHSKTVIGVLPLGTGNSFALTLGIANLQKAVEAIADGRIVDVDLGVVNKRYFANFATIGFAAEVAESTDHDLKAVVGPLAYFAAAVKPFLSSNGFRAAIKSKKKKLKVQTRQIIVVNGRYFGHSAIDPDAGNTDGKLVLFTAQGSSRAEIVRTYAALGLGLQKHLPEGHLLTAPRFAIRTRPKQSLNIDGDALGKTPAKFSVERAALRVIVGEDFESATA